MRYFYTESEKVGTCYFEFQKGDWSEKSHWKPDSLLMEDLDFEDYLFDIITAVIPDFDFYGVTMVTKEQWKSIREKAAKMGGHTLAAIREVDGWVQETFRDYGVFTILGM